MAELKQGEHIVGEYILVELNQGEHTVAEYTLA